MARLKLFLGRRSTNGFPEFWDGNWRDGYRKFTSVFVGVVDTNLSSIAEPDASNLPRLLYYAGVPVENSVAGAVLIRRLLARYPLNCLQIWQTAPKPSQGGLPGADYHHVPLPFQRLRLTRLASWHSSLVRVLSRVLAARLWPQLKAFNPQAVLSVSHGECWSVAAQVAAIGKIPLHLICHDDFLVSGTGVCPDKVTSHPLRNTYRNAASRLCVSRSMEEAYRAWFGVPGTVLLPARGDDCPGFDVPAPPPPADRPFTCAYAGSVHSLSYQQLLRGLAEALALCGGKLLIYGPPSVAQAEMPLLQRSNIEFRGHLPSSELIRRLREEADCLYLPMSFEPELQTNMRLCFPSKLTDYTATGLPILIQGPPDCSAVRWAQEHPGVAVVVPGDDSQELAARVKELADDYGRRSGMGRVALEVGAREFSPQEARRIFYSALSSAGSQSAQNLSTK